MIHVLTVVVGCNKMQKNKLVFVTYYFDSTGSMETYRFGPSDTVSGWNVMSGVA